ncbi:MAG: hypothetical protein JOZ82_04450 [Marmoricola sp.]|nr:hypothetical protein [Marmoricola sp.]
MSWIAVLLIGIALADLAHTVWPVPVVDECVGAALAVWIGLLAGLTDLSDVVALLVIAVVTVAWGQTVTRAFGGGRAWVPLLLLGASLAVAIAVSGIPGPSGGVLGRWLDDVGLPVLHSLSTDRFLLVLGVFLVQLSTGNVLVRLVLAATGTVSPALHATVEDPEQQLKGGRLLGPMERLFILGLGLGGQWTAAGVVVAAKGLLRWPELRSETDQARMHRLTEYFLVGSFMSWLVALGGLLLLAG